LNQRSLANPHQPAIKTLADDHGSHGMSLVRFAAQRTPGRRHHVPETFNDLATFSRGQSTARRVPIPFRLLLTCHTPSSKRRPTLLLLSVASSLTAKSLANWKKQNSAFHAEWQGELQHNGSLMPSFENPKRRESNRKVDLNSPIGSNMPSIGTATHWGPVALGPPNYHF